MSTFKMRYEYASSHTSAPFFTTQYNLSFLKCLQLGRSALECAVKGGHTGIAELLLKSGAKPDLENSVVSDNSIIFCDL
jgi:ankyrin repeat protein